MRRRLLFASLHARRTRTWLALLSVTLGIGVAVTLATLSLHLGDDLARSLRSAGPNFVVLPRGARWTLEASEAFAPARAGLSLPESTFALLKTCFWKHNLLAATPELDLAVRLDSHPTPLVGTWFDDSVATEDGPWAVGVAALHPAWRLQGRWPRAGAGECVLGEALAGTLGRRPGDTLSLQVGGLRSRRRVSGIVDGDGRDALRAFAPLAEVQALANRAGTIDRIRLRALVLPEPRGPQPDLANDPRAYELYMCTAYPSVVAHDLAEHLGVAEVVAMGEVVAGEARVVGRLHILVVLLALAALAASTLGLLATSLATVHERAGEIGLLRVLGATATSIAELLLAEALVIALAGGVLGWALGTLAAAAIRGATFATSIGAVPLLLPIALALAAAIAVLGSLLPLRAALRVRPTEVLHG